jgi:hypothetical protein
MLRSKGLVALAATAMVVSALSIWAKAQSSSTPTPVGPWFGIARPCTPGTRFPTPSGSVDQNVCRDACFGSACPASNFPVDEVTMIPTILADGTVLADDFAELLDHHSTAQGSWEYAGKAVIGGKSFDRYQATFIWFAPRNPPDIDPKNPLSVFQGVIRPRFVTFFDPADPNIMKGYIQPYVYTMTDSTGIVIMQPATPFPAVDPLGRLPVVCDPTAHTNPYCAGTLQFTIRRIPPH